MAYPEVMPNPKPIGNCREGKSALLEERRLPRGLLACAPCGRVTFLVEPGEHEGDEAAECRTLGPERRRGQSGRNSSSQPGGGRSILSWFGGWIDGGGRWWTWSVRSRS